MAEEATSPPDQNDPNSGSSTTNNVSNGNGHTTQTSKNGTSNGGLNGSAANAHSNNNGILEGASSSTTIAPRTSNGIIKKKSLNGLTSVPPRINGINGNGTPAVTKRKSSGGPTNGINGNGTSAVTKRKSNGGPTNGKNGNGTSAITKRKSNGGPTKSNGGNGTWAATTRKSNGTVTSTATTRKSNGSATNGNGFPTATNGTTRKSNGGAINGNGTSSVATTRKSNGGLATITTAKSNGKAINGAPTRTSNGQITPGYGLTTRKSNGNGTTKNGLKPLNGVTNGNGINGNGTGTTTTHGPNGSSTTTAASHDYAPSELTTTPETDYTSPSTVEPVGISTTTDIPEGIEDAEVDHSASDTLGDDQEPDFEIGEEGEHEDEHDFTTQVPSTATLTEPPVGEEEEHTSGKRRGPLEYDLQYMYPEIDLLTKTRRRDWNFNDPEIIRAIWLEAKTHALADWKLKYSKIKRNKEVKVHDNVANQLRNEFRRMKQEREEAEVASLVVGRDAPVYQELTLPTTVTAQMRYKINRDDPPIPDSFIFHFAKYKKPPFLRNAWPHDKCKEPYIGN